MKTWDKTKQIGRYIVTQYGTCCGVSRPPIPGDEKDAKALKDGAGNIPVAESKNWNGAVAKAKGFDAVENPEKYPEKFKLAKQLADLTNAGHSSPVCTPSLFMPWSITEMTAQIARMRNIAPK
jgi:hypothetical protein